MIKWADYLAGMSGTLTRNKYVRRIPGNTEWALLCDRPEYNKSEKKQMAQRETVISISLVCHKMPSVKFR